MEKVYDGMLRAGRSVLEQEKDIDMISLGGAWHSARAVRGGYEPGNSRTSLELYGSSRFVRQAARPEWVFRELLSQDRMHGQCDLSVF